MVEMFGTGLRVGRHPVFTYSTRAPAELESPEGESPEGLAGGG